MAIVPRAASSSPPRVGPELLDRLPPHNLDAEQGVLGSLLLDQQLCDEVALILRPQDFYADAHRKLYAHMLAMHDAGQRIDPMLLIERLRSTGDLEAIGGLAYLTEILQNVPTAAHAMFYARIVHDKATLRGLIHASTEILRSAYDATVEPREMLNQAEERILSIRDRREQGSVNALSDVLADALERIDHKMQHSGAIGGVETGFMDLDNMTGGFHGGELIVLAARPGMGKTALALNIAEHITLQARQSVLFVSLEMSRHELADRLLCSGARVNSHRLRNGTISKEDVRRLIEYANRISSSPLYVDDTPARTITEIAAAARRLKRTQELRLLILDYLQLVQPDDPRDPRQEQVAKITRRLKGMARELDVPILCLAQLNRQSEQGREGHRPKLSHLRESGAIEQDADVVLFVHRDDYYETDAEARAQVAGQADLIIAKQRNGPTGDVKLVWRHELTRFESASHEWQSDDF